YFFTITATLQRHESASLWGCFCDWVTSTENRLYIGWFSVLMIPTLLTATAIFIIAFIAAPPVDIDGIRHNVIFGAIILTSAVIGLQFYPIWEAASADEWLYNGGPYELVLHFLLLFFHLGIRPWIVVAYSAPVAVATAYPFQILGVTGVFGGSIFSAMHGSLVTSSFIRETTENKSANLSAVNLFDFFQYASFNNSGSLHFFLVAWHVVGIRFTALGI
ncbi:hypothetical protein O6H91_06G071500, partial [Diphasiastrum complanatum]